MYTWYDGQERVAVTVVPSEAQEVARSHRSWRLADAAAARRTWRDDVDCMDMRVDMCMDMYMDMCIEICMDMCIDMCMDMCAGICVGMCEAWS